uniref:Uncharacterized protein AlNc14C22G2298 n=1 Tax=Albugo laibachii Nc14 TaxID=890382 RepID=F0W5Z0_9STRA|nr:conserved hypothetical protein [Albugo laibachii Nc14]|eukprot:CCA16531.1 conserved hypothetical protein [Albugo laibachii Nc14]
MREHLPFGAILTIFRCLSAHDIARFNQTSKLLNVIEDAVQKAIDALIKSRFEANCSFVLSDEYVWPRTAYVLKCGEMAQLKTLLTAVYNHDEHIQQQSLRPNYTKYVIVSKAWILALKKRCQLFDQYLQQFKTSKRKKKKQAKPKELCYAEFSSTYLKKEQVISDELRNSLCCKHENLKPFASCVGRYKRAYIPTKVWKKMRLLVDIKGNAPDGVFPGDTGDCWDCVLEMRFQVEERERGKHERFNEHTGGSNELISLLGRKTGFPKHLFAPDGHLLHDYLVFDMPEYYLVPRSWLLKWRNYVRANEDTVPGPILNAELICVAHKNLIPPTYLTLFLSGFTMDEAIRATQSVDLRASCMYEIVTDEEWKALCNLYTCEFAVSFAVDNGSFHWMIPECHICRYGMGSHMEHKQGRQGRTRQR